MNADFRREVESVWSLGKKGNAWYKQFIDMALKTITVFCGSSLGNDPRFEEGAKGTDLFF